MKINADVFRRSEFLVLLLLIPVETAVFSWNICLLNLLKSVLVNNWLNDC